MGKNQSASNLTNIIKQDANGNILLVSGSTTLMSVSSSGAITTTGNVAGTASYASNAELLDGLDSTVFTLTSSFAAQTASFTAFTASQNILNGKYATTGSNTFTSPQTINSNLIVTGSITAQTLVVQTITSSVDFVTGSTRFGSLSSNTHIITGSMYVTGAFYVTTGSVGIGITSPAELLEVSGSLKIGNLKIQNLDGGRIGFNRNTSTGVIYNSGYAAFQINGAYSGADYLHFQNYNSSGSYVGGFVLNNGNVGIGITSPSYLLDVSGSVRILKDGEALRISGDSGYIGFFNTANSTRSGYLQGNTTSLQLASSTASPILFLTSDAEKMRIAANGNVGIGITSPNGNLQFATATNTRKIVLFEGGNNNYQFYGFGVENNALIYSTNSTSDDHVFVAAASSTTRNELMRIKGNGIVTKPYQPYFKYGIGYTGTITTEKKFGTDNGFTVYTDRDAVDSSYFNKATGNFTAPVAGVYIFGCTIMRNASNGTGPIDFNITKNGNRINVYGRGYADSYSTAYQQFTIVVPIKLAASDTVALSMSGNMTVYNDDSWFYGYLLG